MSGHLRLVSYNLHKRRDDADALRAVLTALRPDVLVAQEAVPRLRWRPRTAAFAHDIGLTFAAGGRSSGGTVILTSLRVEVGECFEGRLPVPWGVQRRGAVGARVAFAGLALAVVGTHLDLDAGRRVQHARELLATAESFAAAEDVPLVVAADVNEPPAHPTWGLLAEAGLADAAGDDATPTFPAGGPTSRIDAVFTADGVAVAGYAVGAAALPAGTDPGLLVKASDHLPVAVDLRLRPSPARPRSDGRERNRG